MASVTVDLRLDPHWPVRPQHPNDPPTDPLWCVRAKGVAQLRACMWTPWLVSARPYRIRYAVPVNAAALTQGVTLRMTLNRCCEADSEREGGPMSCGAQMRLAGADQVATGAAELLE